MSDHLFVYGTLLPGQAPAALAGVAAQLRPVGPGRVRGRLYDLGHYPGAVLDAALDSYIAGYVFALPDEPGLLALMDRYERFDPNDLEHSLYLRVRHPVLTNDGNTIKCWMYVYNWETDGALLIESGDYAAFKSGRKATGQ